MKIQFVTKKVDGQFEAATIVDGRFDHAATADSIAKVFSKLVGPFLTMQQEEGTEVAVEVNILSALEAANQNAGLPSVVQQ
jgi:hypothetical protein